MILAKRCPLLGFFGALEGHLKYRGLYRIITVKSSKISKKSEKGLTPC